MAEKDILRELTAPSSLSFLREGEGKAAKDACFEIIRLLATKNFPKLHKKIYCISGDCIMLRKVLLMKSQSLDFVDIVFTKSFDVDFDKIRLMAGKNSLIIFDTHVWDGGYEKNSKLVGELYNMSLEGHSVVVVDSPRLFPRSLFWLNLIATFGLEVKLVQSVLYAKVLKSRCKRIVQRLSGCKELFSTHLDFIDSDCSFKVQ